ncbi:DE-cadherin isoform X2 [Procambarus clarkii]|uniref:DE-cadherin isoform X2 n=1 Tax=Procambarus clarkii TaxID=6728 RepID=UPI003742088B
MFEIVCEARKQAGPATRPATLIFLAGLLTLLAQGCGADAASPSSLSSPSISSWRWLTEEAPSSSQSRVEHWLPPDEQNHRPQHRQYRDQHHHKVRHHHELRHLRRRNLENRFQPKFTHTEYQQAVRENLPVHSSILQVHATDNDMDEHGLIKYSVSDPEHFEIDDGGVLYNVRPLDFEHTKGEYLLHIYAEDQGAARSSRKQAVVQARIKVMDTPEPPYFDKDHYLFSVSEFATAGAYVGTVVARDADNNFETYKLENVQPPGTFVIDNQTGIITVGVNTFSDVWEFNFQAVAIDLSRLNTSVPVKVSIIDENTHKPVFSNCAGYDGITVTENTTAGQNVVLVQATDEDHGVNGQVTYSLLNSFDSFDIVTDNGNGKITTTRRLDRDQEDKEFFLTVIARDEAPKEALQEACSFKVRVKDINDNPPIFDQPAYEQNIATDHIPGKAVLRVTATDMDALENAEVQYSLNGSVDDLGYFNISNTTGVITLIKPLNDTMADKKTFNLKAIATDKGSPPLSNQVGVNIHAVTSGNMPPTIVLREPQNASIPEDTVDNTDVVIVCAMSNIPSKPDVYFTLLNGNTKDTNSDGTFAIRYLESNDPKCPTGSRGVAIYVAMRSLDYETITAYKLILQVVDDQNARADVQIDVKVIDVNDNPPLLQPFDGAIVENSPPSLITTIKAIDKDASPAFRELSYAFDATASADVKSKFALKSNGELWTSTSLDREQSNKYRVPIKVTDGAPGHERMTTYWITVQDINDVPPRFDMTKGIYQVEVPENKVPGKNTGIRLVVIDPDIVNHNDFQIVSGNEQQKFRIDSTTGEVLINKDLDYDKPIEDRTFTMLVRLSDGANEMAEVFITINVTNINDQQPIFTPDKYTYTVTENVDCDKMFGQVSAIDPDLPSTANQNISYYLSMNELQNFTIDKNSGMLYIKGCLDREAATRGTMTLYPRAMDAGGYGHDAEPATVTLNINDINDNHPYIQSPDNSYTKIMENAPPSSVKPVTIRLSDWDTEEHGCPCTLSFESSTSADIMSKFKVTAMTGFTSQYELQTLKTLDREAQKTYQIPFRTSDSEGVSGTRYLTVEVGDENDSPMTDGSSAIKVYNYQGQFPSMVIGSVYVTDLDDYDVVDKTFEIDPTTSSEVSNYFDVGFSNGNITMQKGTPEGTYVLRVKVIDKFRNETAIGEVNIAVVDLTEEAVMQSGSFMVAGYTAHEVLQQRAMAAVGTSLYERLKQKIGSIHGIGSENVDIFAMRDVEGGVNIRYNCHSSPYYTAARLNGVMMSHREELMSSLTINISRVNINDCLYELQSPCGTTSCQQFLRPNITSPLVIGSDTTTMVGVDITEEYLCDCGALEPLPSVCYSGFCLNGGECIQANNTLSCRCPDNDYGPRCELKSARFEKGYAWYEPLKVCENASLFMSFDTREDTGVLLYSGPTVTRPWSNYPRDFIYVFLEKWWLKVFIDLGTGTSTMSIPLEKNNNRAFDFTVTWNDREVSFEVFKCLGNNTIDNSNDCRKSVQLQGLNVPSHLLNVGAPLQVGGVAAMVSFKQLASSYGWTLEPTMVDPFFGCVLELRHNNYLYDLNSTDYDKNTYKPCDAPVPARVIVGKESIVIIVVSLLGLILLVLLILCLARRNKKSISYPELDGIVKETIGGTDLEGFGEKDMTQYDLKLLRVGPNGQVCTGKEKLPRQGREAPLAQMPDGLSIGDFITDNIKKVDKDPSDFDDVRHYCFEGDEMSIASLSSIGSGGSSEGSEPFDYKNDWGHRFEKLNEIYGRASDEEDDSDYEFPDVPKQSKRDSLRQLRKPKTPNSTPAQSPSEGLEAKGAQEMKKTQKYHEAHSPMASFPEGQGAESWC